MANSEPEQTTVEDVNEQIAQRKAKLAEMRKQGQAYPNHFKRDSLAGDLHREYDSEDHDALESKSIPVKVGGRMMTRAA